MAVCPLWIGYSLNGQKSLFANPSWHSVVVYVILTRIIFSQVQRSFSFLCTPWLYRGDFHTSTYEGILCSPISQKPPKTFSHCCCVTLSKHFSGQRQSVPSCFAANLRFSPDFDTVSYSLPLLGRRLCLFFFHSWGFRFLLRELLRNDCWLLSAICFYSTWYCISLCQQANGRQM